MDKKYKLKKQNKSKQILTINREFLRGLKHFQWKRLNSIIILKLYWTNIKSIFQVIKAHQFCVANKLINK